MNQTSNPPKGAIRLPHGAWLVKEIGRIFVPVGDLVLNFDINEIESFADTVDDIVTVLHSNSHVNVHICESCGTEIEETDYIEPEGEDLQ